MLENLLHAALAVGLLTALITVACLAFTSLPLAAILFGEAIGMPAGIALLTLASPRRRRR